METSSQQHDAEGQLEEYKATFEEWKTFLRLRAWQDLQHYMESALEEAKDLLSVSLEERLTKETDDSLRGGIKMLRRMLSFPTEQMEELENDRGRDDTDGRDIG